ncbi:hypothetical protein Bpfe_014733, partial [Biomphalaria pfeifferi]
MADDKSDHVTNIGGNISHISSSENLDISFTTNNSELLLDLTDIGYHDEHIRSTERSLNSPDHHFNGLLSPQSLRFNPFNVSSSQSISESQDKRFDPLVFGDPTFISSYFDPTPDRDGAHRAWRRSPQDDGVSQAFGSHVSELTSSPHFTQSALASPVESRAAFISVPIQNVIIQDYTDKVGQALASKQHAATSTTNSNLVNPQVEIRGHPTTMTKVIDRGMAFNKALTDYAKPNPAHLRQQCLIEDDGGEDDSYTREDCPLLDSHLQSAPPTRQAGQAMKPSSRSRAARDEAADFSGCTPHDFNKQGDSDASHQYAIAADMTGHDGEKDSLKGYVRGKPTHNGSMDTNVLKQWSSAEQRRRSESEQSVALSVSYRHCHRKRTASLTDKLALRQLIAVVVLCLLFMTGEAV